MGIVVCASPRILSARVQVLVGDQRQLTTLHSWLTQIEGGFDFIIDDGGHTNQQQMASSMLLIQRLLKPGGLYVIEDLSESR
jgi:predicted O-methyltransferase YrrM